MAHSNKYEKHKHLIGTQVNNWLVLDIIADNEKHHVSALAKCSCGTTKEVRLTYIINNRVKDCGCGHKERIKNITRNKYEYLLDTEINGWTVLDIIPPDEKHRNTFALCRCRCGTQKEVRVTYLINGRSKDCGCGRKETLRETRTINLVGQRFGKLVVKEMLDKRNSNGRIIYRCKCDCGNDIDVLGYSLTTNHTLSCGCLLSYWNMYIGKFLKDNGIEYKSEYTIHIGDKYYRFDFYLPQYNLFIEYDGRQHYEPVRFYGDSVDEDKRELEITQEHDRIKNSYCEKNNIDLLRIPYWESKNIETIINDHLQRLNEKGFVKDA